MSRYDYILKIAYFTQYYMDEMLALKHNGTVRCPITVQNKIFLQHHFELIILLEIIMGRNS